METKITLEINDPSLAIQREAQRKALAAGHAIKDHIQAQMAVPKTGREYRVPGTKRTYHASKPGEYPAIRTGVLRGRIRVQPDPEGVAVGTDSDYGAILEAGLRPWLSRAPEEIRTELTEILGQGWTIS